MNNSYDLQRFVQAQNGQYDQVCAELRHGRKTGHWIWYIFPQLRGLGHSPMAHSFGISSKEEAVAYLQHPVLGPRLIECTKLINLVDGKSIGEILSYPDDLKFRSSMTLFSAAAEDGQVFADALEKYFGGERDPLTMQRL